MDRSHIEVEKAHPITASPTTAYARTGNDPIPFTLTGTAPNRNPARQRLQPRHVLHDGDTRSQQRRMHRPPPTVGVVDVEESIPTSGAPAPTRYAAASAVRNGWPSKYASVRQWLAQPVWTRIALPRDVVGRRARRGRSRGSALPARYDTPSRSASDASGNSERSAPSAKRWNGLST